MLDVLACIEFFKLSTNACNPAGTEFHYVYTNRCLKKKQLAVEEPIRAFSRKIKIFEWSYDFESSKVTQ